MDIIKVVICDDHVIFRKGLSTILNEINEVKVIGEASNGQELLNLMKKQDVDVVLMDIRMPVMDGIEATKKIIEKKFDTRIIALTMHEEIGYFNQMIEAGAHGYLLKKTNRDELETALKQVIRGEYYFAPEFLAYAEKHFPKKVQEPPVILTEREKEVLELICKGYSNPEIAKKLFLSERTIDGHRANLLDKTGAKNAPHLVMYAIKHGLIKT